MEAVTLWILCFCLKHEILCKFEIKFEVTLLCALLVPELNFT